MKENYPKAYTEVLEILKYMPTNDVNKIPKELIETLKNKKDNNYTFTIDEDQDFSKLKILNETEAIMVNIFRDYWASPEQYAKIRAKQQYDMQIIEEEKKKKYNVDNIFKDRKERNIEYTNNNVQMIEYKESILKRIIIKIKNLFTKK
ncbi:MAG: hypothetical protein ACLTBX_01260 [Clostridia bacterium]